MILIEQNKIHAFITMLLMIGITLILVITLFIFGPIIEGKYFPVTKDVEVKLISQTKEKMLFSVIGTKVRNCQLLSARVLVYDSPEDDVGTKGAIYVVDDGQGDVVRALGKQNLGVWAILPPGNYLKVQTTYQCHSLWNTEVQLGEWKK